MSTTSDLVTGLAQYLATAGLATYRADGTPYTSGETALYFNDMPASPDRVVALTAYATTDQAVVTLGAVRVQVRTRGLANDVLDVDTLADSIFTLLHGAVNLTFGTMHVVQILRVSSATLGMDDQSRRWMRSDNYHLDVDYPTTPNRSL